MKSVQELQSLVNNVLLADDFNVDDLKGFNARREIRRLDGESINESQLKPFSLENGWKEHSVYIKLPAEKVLQHEADAPELEVKGVYVRSLMELITTGVQDKKAKSFHYAPFSLFWKPTPNDQPQRVFSELYNTDAFIAEHRKIQELPTESGSEYERAIIALQLFSDSTHLAAYGTHSMWPVYTFFGNESKYDKAKPTQFSAHHLAYIPSLPDSLQDSYMKIFGDPASAATLTHLKRDLMHAIWELLLDPEFIHAYEHGIILKCADGVIRRLFPRFFTYSADYPEKVLLTTIRNLGRCPCPRCLIQKTRIGDLGKVVDGQRRSHVRLDSDKRRRDVELTRRWIFEKGLGINSKSVNDVLQEESYVPTRNAFSTRLQHFGFDFFSMFVPDFMHEFELGVWKAIFIHLMRILYSAGNDCIQSLNWRQVTLPFA
ncbi:hypothetical protein B0H34DRAFT_758798 [Crassisporium funariophilum]|nr:hypothetical protein B0H34DRAFT_758798 [Crassisporium funariophilum]